MPNKKQNDAFEFLANYGWRTLPCLMASKLTEGRFTRYNYIKYISKIIASKIVQGNARVILSVPPRHGKSYLVSQWVPTWYLSLYPEKNIILTSYEADFAAQWGRSVRNIINDHGKKLGIELTKDSTSADRWQLIQGGGMKTAGVGGPITGSGASVIVIDDPIKNWEQATSKNYRQKTIDWFNSTLYTRLEPQGSIITIMTRWHEDDLAGYLTKEHTDKWENIVIPAIAEENDPLGRDPGMALNPSRYNIEALDQIKQAVGAKVWNALYQQRPSSEDGNIFKHQHFRFYEQMPPVNFFNEIAMFWDMTFTSKATSDFVVGQVWGRKDSSFYLLDQIRDRMGMNETISAFISMYQKWPQARLKVIENKANGPAVEDMLKSKIPGIVLWEPKGDKVSRAHAVMPYFEGGNVYFPTKQVATFIDHYLQELVTFPNSDNDDCVDATTMALLKLGESLTQNASFIKVLIRK